MTATPLPDYLAGDLNIHHAIELDKNTFINSHKYLMPSKNRFFHSLPAKYNFREKKTYSRTMVGFQLLVYQTKLTCSEWFNLEFIYIYLEILV